MAKGAASESSLFKSRGSKPGLLNEGTNVSRSGRLRDLLKKNTAVIGNEMLTRCLLANRPSS